MGIQAQASDEETLVLNPTSSGKLYRDGAIS